MDYKSGLELAFARCLDGQSIRYEYETVTLAYEIPARKAKYKVDFVLPDQGLLVETKGQFRPDDRKKMLLIKEQHPDKNLIMVFGKPHNRISPRSKTTYADWCDQHEIAWLDIADVDAWLQRQGKRA